MAGTKRLEGRWGRTEAVGRADRCPNPPPPHPSGSSASPGGGIGVPVREAKQKCSAVSGDFWWRGYCRCVMYLAATGRRSGKTVGPCSCLTPPRRVVVADRLPVARRGPDSGAGRHLRQVRQLGTPDRHLQSVVFAAPALPIAPGHGT